MTRCQRPVRRCLCVALRSVTPWLNNQPHGNSHNRNLNNCDEWKPSQAPLRVFSKYNCKYNDVESDKVENAAQKVAYRRRDLYCLHTIHIKIPVQKQKPNHLAGITIPVRAETKTGTPMSARQAMAIPRSFSASKAKVIRHDARLGGFIQEYADGTCTRRPRTTPPPPPSRARSRLREVAA
jgi:hypothetical protein